MVNRIKRPPNRLLNRRRTLAALIATLLLLTLGSVFPSQLMAAESSVDEVSATLGNPDVFVVDDADLLTDEAEDELNDRARELYDEQQINLLVVTVPERETADEETDAVETTQETADRLLNDQTDDLPHAGLIVVDPNQSPAVAVSLRGKARSVLSKYGTDNVYLVQEGTDTPLEGQAYYSEMLLRVQDELIERINEDTSLVGIVSGTPVFDAADLFSDEEEAKLADRAVQLGEEYGISVVLVTTLSTEGRTAREYADDFYDYNSYRTDGVLLLISMDPREVYISTAGIVIDTITNANVETILDDIFDNNDLSGGEFAGAAQTFLHNVGRYMKAGPGGVIRELKLWEIILPVVLGLVVALIMVTSAKKRYAKSRQTPGYDYKRMAKVNYTVLDDRLVDKKVTSTLIQTGGGGGSGGGGGGSHTGSSGSSHGGGGRSF